MALMKWERKEYLSQLQSLRQQIAGCMKRARASKARMGTYGMTSSLPVVEVRWARKLTREYRALRREYQSHV